MVLNNRSAPLIACLILILFLSGCELLDLYTYKDTRSLEENGNKIRLIIATILPYIGKSKEEVKAVYGEPTKIEHRIGTLTPSYQEGKVQFDETWEYVYPRGMPGVNTVKSITTFFLNDGKVYFHQIRLFPIHQLMLVSIMYDIYPSNVSPVIIQILYVF